MFWFCSEKLRLTSWKTKEYTFLFGSWNECWTSNTSLYIDSQLCSKSFHMCPVTFHTVPALLLLVVFLSIISVEKTQDTFNKGKGLTTLKSCSSVSKGVAAPLLVSLEGIWSCFRSSPDFGALGCGCVTVLQQRLQGGEPVLQSCFVICATIKISALVMGSSGKGTQSSDKALSL